MIPGTISRGLNYQMGDIGMTIIMWPQIKSMKIAEISKGIMNEAWA
jgi:hypothetical protein